jgi:hypothetical protein
MTAANHSSAANVASSMLENFLPLRFLQVRNEVEVESRLGVSELQNKDLAISGA